jgi:hypothetical protein
VKQLFDVAKLMGDVLNGDGDIAEAPKEKKPAGGLFWRGG